MFNIFKKKKIEKNEEDGTQEEQNNDNPKPKKISFKEPDEEKQAMQSLTPYKTHQKLVIWNSGKGERIWGYPVALIPNKNHTYTLLYRRRAPDFIDEIASTLKAMIFGKKEQYRVVHIPEGAVDVSDEIITIYAHSFSIINNYTDEALPFEQGDPRKRELYIIALKQMKMYKTALEKLGVELPNVIDASLKMNPTMRAYQGKETQSDRKKGNKSKEFSGMEMGFSFDRFVNELKGDGDE